MAKEPEPHGWELKRAHGVAIIILFCVVFCVAVATAAFAAI